MKVSHVLYKTNNLKTSFKAFEKLGFNEIDKETIPEHKIWADCVKCKHFPVCNEIALTISIL